MSNIIQSINRLAGLSKDRLINQQSAYIPRFEDAIECISHKYILDGIYHNSSFTDEIYFKLNPDLIHLSITNKIPLGIHTLDDIINTKKIGLFMLFANGIYIPYDVMKFVHDDYDDYYLIIDKDNEYYNSLCHSINTIHYVCLPGDIEYTFTIEGGVPANTLFAFNEDGKFIRASTGKKYLYTYKNNTNFYSVFDVPSSVKNVNVLELNDLKHKNRTLSSNNVIIFADGLLVSGPIKPVPRSTRSEANNNICNKITYTNPSIDELDMKFNLSLLTVNDGEELGEEVYVCLSINDLSDESLDNICNIDRGYALTALSSHTTEINPELLDSFNPSSTDDIVAYIMKYNPSILNDIIEDASNISIERISYSDTKRITVSHKDHDDGILIFVDGLLYNMNYMQYDKNCCVVDMTHIQNKSTAIIELLRFHNINNTSGTINMANYIGHETEYSGIGIDETIALFSKDPNNSEFTYPVNGLQIFPTEYSIQHKQSYGPNNVTAPVESSAIFQLEKEQASVIISTEYILVYDSDNDPAYDKENASLTLGDSYYNDKVLHYYHKNRFIAKSFSFESSSATDLFEVNLGSYFEGCFDYSKYMVFINGVIIQKDKYRLTLPVRRTTPFYEYKLYLSVPFKKTDIVSVIYTPNAIIDIPAEIDVNTGDVTISGNACNYQISKNLNMLWINGRKVPNSDITDIGFNKLHVNKDTKSARSVYLVKYINDLEELSGIGLSKWDQTVVNSDDRNAMLGISNVSITNTAADPYSGRADISAIMHELIRDQYISRSDVTSPFIYGYSDIDTSILDYENVDSEDNAILDTADANKENSIGIDVVKRKEV